jgi:alpha/beta superfamily hydrolase
VPRNKSFFLNGPAGRLEALLQLPEGPPIGAGLVCHAHPLQGGMMHFKVVFRAAKALREAGYACLRFNFRGVGLSEGLHDNGVGEEEDVRAGLSELTRLFPGLPQVLGGFSFGALMALRVGVSDPGVEALFGLGFPLRSVPDPKFLKKIRPPLLLVQGEKDAFGSGAEVQALVAELSIPARVVVVEGADHFFAGREEAVSSTLEEWATGLLA